MLANKKIILGITGSIAATKCLELIKILLEKKVHLQIVLTKAAEQFVSFTELKQILRSDQIYKADDLFNPEDEMLHIKLARFPDIILIAPASANMIAKLRGGFADDLLSSICIASDNKIVIAPAMNQQMWHNPFTQDNIHKLQQNNITIIGPDEGLQACGDYGYGRMVEPNQIVNELEELTSFSDLFVGKKIIITAGPTIEKIDPVRYISNFSSGKMGYSLAKTAQLMGAKVILISGPTSLPKPTNMQVEFVTSAQEMYEKVLAFTDQADIFISCAAVADYTPAQPQSQKIKKKQMDLEVKLKPNIDILKTISTLNKGLFIVGFAAETENIIANAQKKLVEKNLDMIIANDVSNGAVFGSDVSQITILTKNSSTPMHIPQQSKQTIANIILKFILKELNEKSSSSS
jgi:phosphopantothenoylcysteine decarboxylase/phosphopantothenate--cysteine ligase